MNNLFNNILNKLNTYSSLITFLALLVSSGALVISIYTYNLTIKGANFDISISSLDTTGFPSLKEDGEYYQLEARKMYGNKKNELQLEKDTTQEPIDNFFKASSSFDEFLCFSITNKGVMPSKNVFVRLSFSNLYLIEKDEEDKFDTCWKIERNPVSRREILSLKHEYDENTLFYPHDTKDLCINLVKNYELWVDKDGGTIEASVVGENRILKSKTFSIKLDN